MTIWKEWLEKKRVLIADGGWGTELFKRGLKPGEVPERWNIDRVEEVRAVAASYVMAGAEIILTNTFGGSPMKLAKVGFGSRTTEINRLGAEISKEAAAGRALVFGSMGPTGELLKPLGPATEAEMFKCFEEQARALVEGGVDGIVIETMTDLVEAKAALAAIRQNHTLPVVVSMTFDKKRRGYATIMGVRPEQAASELEKAGADIVGANCGTGIDHMIEVTQLMRRATSLPIWCKPNAGLPELIDGNTVYRETPEQMASKLKALVEAGATIVGGCCGTTPVHIRALVLERDKLVAKESRA
jgi:5-methyltetrahydrofolate--homocysteine methyltransferase